MIGSGKPEIHRKSRRLHGEGKREEAGKRHQRRGFAQSVCLQRDIGHVERAEDGVEITHRDQEKRRADEVQDDIFQRAVDLLPRRAEHDEAEGRDQQHFEPDIEVEDVSGQERAGNAGHQQHQEGIEAVTSAAGVNIAAGVNGAGQRDDGGRE